MSKQYNIRSKFPNGAVLFIGGLDQEGTVELVMMHNLKNCSLFVPLHSDVEIQWLVFGSILFIPGAFVHGPGELS